MMKDKKIGLFSVIIPVIIMFLSVMLLFSVLSARKRGEEPRILGYSFHLVMSESMSGMIEKDDFVIAKNRGFDSVEVGDVIIYHSPDEDGKKIIHKVVALDKQQGYATTRGINNGTDDNYQVEQRHYIGTYVWHSGTVGKIILFFTDFKNLLFTAIIAVCLVVIIKQLRLFVKCWGVPK